MATFAPRSLCPRCSVARMTDHEKGSNLRAQRQNSPLSRASGRRAHRSPERERDLPKLTQRPSAALGREGWTGPRVSSGLRFLLQPASQIKPSRSQCAEQPERGARPCSPPLGSAPSLPRGADVPAAPAPGPGPSPAPRWLLDSSRGLSAGLLFPANYHLMKSVSLRNSAFD